jgi:hypothetical protein
MTMRSLLVFGLLMTLCTSASAATVNQSSTHYHVTAGHSQGVASGFTVPSSAYAHPGPPLHDGFGGGSAGGDMGGFGSGAHVGGIDIDHVGQFNPTMLRFGRHWSGYTLYPYDPDCNDFFFRHPDYPWLSGCS